MRARTGCGRAARTGCDFCVLARHAGGAPVAQPWATVTMPPLPDFVLASELMKIRAYSLAFVKLAAATAVTGGLAGCAGARGKVVVDSPALPYQAPDISEITGIEEPDTDSDSDEGSAAPAPAPEPGK